MSQVGRRPRGFTDTRVGRSPLSPSTDKRAIMSKAKFMSTGLAPVLCLFLITPLIAEYLLGNVPMTWIVLLPVLMLLYGAGAVLIRELARRSGRGWPTIVTLALAYAVVEEAFATQSWFNPNFEGQRLLDYGYVAGLGTSPSWITFILILHVAWSICTPIALTEILFTRRRLQPWLGTTGLWVVAALFVLSIVLLMAHFIAKDGFVAPPQQFAVSGAVAVALTAAAFILFPARARGASPGDIAGTLPQPSAKVRHRPWAIGTLAFVTGSAFFILQEFAPGANIPAYLTTGLSLAMGIGMLCFIAWSARRGDWSDRHRYALAAGAVLVYCWWGFFVEHDLYGAAALPRRVLLVAAALILLVRTGSKLLRAPQRP